MSLYEPSPNEVMLLGHYIKQGEYVRAEELAEDAIHGNPEAPRGYFLLGLYHHFINQQDEALVWWDKALALAPTNEDVLSTYTHYLFFSGINPDKWRELVFTGIKHYPDNSYFHYQYAQAHLNKDHEISLAAYEEAIRLDPQQEDYLANYSMLLYHLGRKKEAEKYEQLALSINPEHVQHLLRFAELAYHFRKYKKAQMLMDEAIRLAPDNEEVRQAYARIHPTRNIVVRTKNDLDYFALILPGKWIWKAFKEKVNIFWILLFLFFIESTVLYLLLGPSSLILIGAYAASFYIIHRFKRSMLEKSGITDKEETLMKEQTEKNQKAAIQEMRAAIASDAQPENNDPSLTQEELEQQLAKMWQTENISAVKARMEDKETEDTTDNKPLAPFRPAPPQEYSQWPFFVMFAAVLILFGVRSLPMFDNGPEPVAADTDLQESIQEAKPEDFTFDTEANDDVVQHFIDLLKEDATEEQLTELVSSDYSSTILDNMDSPFIQAIAAAEITKEIEPYKGLPITYALVTNEQEDVQAIIGVTSGTVSNIYAEGWSTSEADLAKLDELMTEMEK
ncbi:tetratricopeptide repeat protein [Terribacillus goriensis]|uniref:tetratricopeptide repeat protein n=1 Tax=Terribacillus saccharophilus TaxID=361277 RepID=UPI0039836C5C